MKAKLSLLLSLSLIGVLFFAGCNSEPDPSEYHDNMVYYYTKLDDSLVILEKNIWDTTVNLTVMEEDFSKLLDMIKKNKEALKQIQKLKNDPGLYDAIVNFYDEAEKVLNNEYKQIIDLIKSHDLPDSVLFLKVSELDSIYIQKLTPLEDKAIKAQKDFADAYGIVLKEDEK